MCVSPLVDRQYQHIKADSKAKLAASKQILESSEPDVQEGFHAIQAVRLASSHARSFHLTFHFQNLPNQTEESLEQELEDLKAKLDMYTTQNPGVIEQYEARKQEIANLEKAIEQREKTEAKVQQKIKTAQDNWQPRLEELVKSIGFRFSAAFDSALFLLLRHRCAFTHPTSRHRLRGRDQDIAGARV
jgi:chromosome segregation ATPase